MFGIILKILVLLTTVSCQRENVEYIPDQTVFLYPNGQDADSGAEWTAGPVTSNGLTGEEIYNPDNGNLENIGGGARIDLYFPEKPNGQMVIVCPGGGYVVVSSVNEGSCAAKWLTDRGITAAVMKYRLPAGHDNVPLTDVLNAFRYCRGRSEEWGIRQIGVMGFSAGGHLASTVSNYYTDDMTRPDFAVLLYPVITFETGVTHQGSVNSLVGTTCNPVKRQDLIEYYSMENHVTEDTPPTFISVSSDDSIVPVENSIRYYNALLCHNVPVEMHLFPYGNHGWGFQERDKDGNNVDALGCARNEFSTSLSSWLVSIRANCIK